MTDICWAEPIGKWLIVNLEPSPQLRGWAIGMLS
jgi:hypothetical protein